MALSSSFSSFVFSLSLPSRFSALFPSKWHLYLAAGTACESRVPGGEEWRNGGDGAYAPRQVEEDSARETPFKARLDSALLAQSAVHFFLVLRSFAGSPSFVLYAVSAFLFYFKFRCADPLRQAPGTDCVIGVQRRLVLLSDGSLSHLEEDDKKRICS